MLRSEICGSYTLSESLSSWGHEGKVCLPLSCWLFQPSTPSSLIKQARVCLSRNLTEPWQWLSGTVKKLRGLSETFLKSGSPLAHLLLGSIQGLLDPFREDSGSSLEVRAHLILRHRQLSRCLSLLTDCCALPPCDSTATSAIVGGGGATQCQNTRARARAARDQSARPVATCQRN